MDLFKNVIGLVLLIAFGGCITDNKKLLYVTSPSYRTTDASELFFKNVRAIYYDKEEMTSAKLEVFRIKHFNDTDSSSPIKLAIVMNWIKDEAYVLVESKGIIAEDKAILLCWKNQKGDMSKQKFDLKNKDDYFLYTGFVYDLILNNIAVTYMVDGETNALFTDTKDREAFRKTMFDFYNLVEIL